MLALLPLALSLAPEIARWLSGDKAQNITQQAVEVVQAITGTSDPVEAAKIAADPTKALELKVALAKITADAHATEIQAEVDSFRSILFDVADSRNQTIELAKQGSSIAWAAPVLSCVIVVGFFISPTILKYLDQSTNQIWLGALIAGFTGVINYWLGASASGRRAQEAVQNVVQQTADTVNAAANQTVKQSQKPTASQVIPQIIPQAPPVVVVPAATPAVVSTQPIVTQPAVRPIPPVTSVKWKVGPYGGARWQVLPEGVLVEGDPAVARSVGEPVTVRKVWANYGSIISDVCGRLGVPAEVVVGMICTESKGDAGAVYVEPDGRASGGLMQVLNTTGSQVLKRTVTAEDLKDPTINITAGVLYMVSLKSKTDFFDPILSAAAHNAGGIYPPRDQDDNRFKLRSTGDHLERMIRWYGDACFVSKKDNWFK